MHNGQAHLETAQFLAVDLQTRVRGTISGPQTRTLVADTREGTVILAAFPLALNLLRNCQDTLLLLHSR